MSLKWRLANQGGKRGPQECGSASVVPRLHSEGCPDDVMGGKDG